MSPEMFAVMSRINEDRENEKVMKIKRFIRNKQDNIKWLEDNIEMMEKCINDLTDELDDICELNIEDAYTIIMKEGINNV